MTEEWLTALLIAAAIIGVWMLVGTVRKAVRERLREVTVWENQWGLLYRDGRRVRTLEDGKHRFWGRGHEVLLFDRRITELVVQGQEVITSDSVSLKLSAVAQWRITDPVKFCTVSDDSARSLYSLIQLALRRVVGSLSLDEIVEKKASFGEPLLELVVAPAADWGIEVVRAEVRDVMLGAELRQSYQGIVTAKKESLARLEKARGEAAALRTLANAARMLENHPDLLRLKVLETLKETGPKGGGNTLVIGLPEEFGLRHAGTTRWWGRTAHRNGGRRFGVVRRFFGRWGRGRAPFSRWLTFPRESRDSASDGIRRPRAGRPR